MNINPETLRHKAPSEILQELIKQVTKSEEEIEAKETRGGRTSDLKMFVADNRGFSVGNISKSIEDLVVNDRVDAHGKKFFNQHVIKEEVLDEDISYVEIVSSDVDRTSEFVLVTQQGYLWILTTELRKWTKKTFENLVNYHPNLERVYLSSEDLEEIAGGIEGGSVSGFTAKYFSPARDRHATLRFHGAEEGDIEKAKKHFGAKPSRIEFDQQNSPEAVVQGSEAKDGIITFESVRVGSENLAVNTAEVILGEYESRDFKNYEVETIPKKRYFENFQLIDGYTSIELTDPEERIENLREEIEESVLSSYQYDYGYWRENTLFIHDKKHGELFELAIEDDDLVLFARESTTALSLRDFCKNILADFDSTYNLNKTSVDVSRSE